MGHAVINKLKKKTRPMATAQDLDGFRSETWRTKPELPWILDVLLLERKFPLLCALWVLGSAENVRLKFVSSVYGSIFPFTSVHPVV